MERAAVPPLLACSLMMASGCAREPLPWVCPTLAAGDLILTEVSRPGQWLEIYNASGALVDLEGLHLSIVVSLQDGEVADLIVREPDIDVAPGEYAVIGRLDDQADQPYLDYAYEFDAQLFDTTTRIDLVACGVVVDSYLKNDVPPPTSGSWSLDGSALPDASSNDDLGRWCEDDSEDVFTGVAGTPGLPNQECPVP